MPNKLTYPTDDVPLDNGGEVLWSEGLFKTSDSPNLMVSYLCAARKILGESCPQKGHIRASHALGRKERNFRALHEECHRKIKGLIVVRATFPGTDNKLKPSSSRVLWTKAHRVEVKENGRVVRRRWCVPVICGGCGEQHDVTVRRGLSDERELTADDLALDAGATGECALFCRDCWLKYFRRDLNLPDKSQVFFSEWNEKGLPAICGKCETKQLLDCHTPGADLAVRDWPCENCGHLLGMKDHPSGAKLLWLDRKPASEDRPTRKEKVGFLCAHCGGRHYALAHNTQCRAWRGRADECKRGAGDPKFISEDKKSEVSDTWARFSTEKNGMVVIEYEKCPHKPEIPHDYAVSAYKKLPAICPDCRRKAIREALSMVKVGGLAALGKGQLGDDRKSREEKQRERREKRLAARLGRITKEVLRWKRAGHVREEVTADAVAKDLSIGGTTGGNVMMQQLRDDGYRISWPLLRGDIWDKGAPRQLQKNGDKKSGVTPEKTRSKIVEARRVAVVVD